MKKIIIATALTLGMSGFAFADGITAESGLYVNGQAGWSFAESPSLDTPPPAALINSYSSTENDDNYVLGATIGYDYAFTSNWMAGLELGYLYMGYNTYDQNIQYIGGGTTNNSFTLTNWGIQLMATGTYVMSNGLNFFAKVGGIYQETESSGSVTVGSTTYNSVTHDNSGVIPAAAVGVGYLFTQNLNLALQYERTFGTNWDNSDINSSSSPMTQNIVTLGLSYKFPL